MQFDGFIKLLLRSYTGLFTEFISIDERSLAKKAGIKQDLVYQYLKKLSSLKIIKYIPQRKTPLVIYTEERLDSKAVLISADNYSRRKEIYNKRIENVLEYASQQSRCRSRYLLSYFGENESSACGKCDVCTNENEPDLNRAEFDLIRENIRKLIDTNPLPLETVVDNLEHNEKKTMKVIQWLLDNERIFYQQDKRLKWRI